MGLLGVAELVPLIVFGLYGGALADRFDRRALLRWCEAGQTVTAALLLVNTLLPHPAIWPLYALAAVAMGVAALQRPSFDASVPRLVPPEQLTASAALLSISSNTGVIIGASLGGVIAVAPGPWLVYALHEGSLVISFGILGFLRLPRAVARDAGSAGRPLDGIRYARRRQDLIGSYLADRCLCGGQASHTDAWPPHKTVGLTGAPAVLWLAWSSDAVVKSALPARIRRHRRGNRRKPGQSGSRPCLPRLTERSVENTPGMSPFATRDFYGTLGK